MATANSQGAIREFVLSLSAVAATPLETYETDAAQSSVRAVLER